MIDTGDSPEDRQDGAAESANETIDAIDHTSADGAAELQGWFDERHGSGAITATAHEAELSAEIESHTEQDGVATVLDAEVTYTGSTDQLQTVEWPLADELRQHGVKTMHHTLESPDAADAWREQGYTIDGDQAVKDLERTEKQQKGDSLEHDAHTIIAQSPDIVPVYPGARTRGFDGAYFDTRDGSLVVWDAKNFGSSSRTGYVNEVSSFADQHVDHNFDKIAASIDAAAEAHPEHAAAMRRAFAEGARGDDVRYLVIGSDTTAMTDARQRDHRTDFVTIDELPGTLRQHTA